MIIIGVVGAIFSLSCWHDLNWRSHELRHQLQKNAPFCEMELKNVDAVQFVGRGTESYE
jgi:hypothetical protein